VAFATALHERLPARPHSVPLLRRAVDEFAAACGASDRQRSAIALAVSEAVGNAVVHAYVGRELLGDVEVAAQLHGAMLQVTVCDDGVGMHPRLDSPGAGLGLGLIASITDDFELAELDPGVCVRMMFALGS
jgi:anti-sigma regulatory factor (Ser/Thr protein kinase)